VLRTDTLTNTIVNNSVVNVPVEKIVEKKIKYGEQPAEIILFDLGSSNIKPIYRERLNNISAILKREANVTANIIGHTDATGSGSANEKLSLKRAQAVSNYLVSKGVNNAKLNASNMAFSQPAVEGKDSQANGQNRRVEIILNDN